MPNELVATVIHGFMGSGRTRPMKCACDYANGQPAGDYVVKVKTMDRGLGGLVCELLGSLLASHFGIATPQPAIVRIDRDLAIAALAPGGEGSTATEGIVGLNFGSKLIVGGATWPVDKPPPQSLRGQAASIFAFDALLQNPDRRAENPNLLVRGDEIFAIDHEEAFSFLLAIGARSAPWSLNDQPYLKNHVFASSLQGSKLDYSGFRLGLEDLTPGALAEMLRAVPQEWSAAWENNISAIEAHVAAVVAHANEFVAAVQGRLA